MRVMKELYTLLRPLQTPTKKEKKTTPPRPPKLYTLLRPLQTKFAHEVVKSIWG